MASGPTIKDIAAECGVSSSTVSLVLNGNPRISESTRKKVQEIIDKRSYQPNHQARGLASKSSNILSVVVPQFQNAFSDPPFNRLLAGIFEATANSPYKIMLEVASSQYVCNTEYLNTLKGRRADGMLYIGSTLHDRYLLEFENEPYPFVLLNHYFPGSGLSYVSADYRQAGQLAAQHLLELGHEKIGIISNSRIQTALDSLDAFKDEYVSSGHSVEKLAVAPDCFDEKEGFRAAETLLKEHPACTAWVCSSDELALGAFRAASDAGKHLPKDLSIMGMNNLFAGRYTTPQLTTIHTPLEEIGQTAAAAVMNIFNEKSNVIRTFLPVQLEQRGSTGPACTSS